MRMTRGRYGFILGMEGSGLVKLKMSSDGLKSPTEGKNSTDNTGLSAVEDQERKQTSRLFVVSHAFNARLMWFTLEAQTVKLTHVN